MTEGLLYIALVLLATTLVGWTVHRLRSLPLDLFNLANGLLLAAVFAMGSIGIDAAGQPVGEINVGAYTALVILFQVAVGILLLSGFFAWKGLTRRRKRSIGPWLKGGAGYATSFILGVVDFYLAGVLFLHRDHLVDRLNEAEGKLDTVAAHMASLQPLDWRPFVGLFTLVMMFTLMRTYRGELQFSLLGHSIRRRARSILHGNPDQGEGTDEHE